MSKKTEQKEKQHRVEDAISATKAAAEEGIVAGGGTAYIRAIEELNDLKVRNKDEQIGVDIVNGALVAPTMHIANNAGIEGNVVVENVKKLRELLSEVPEGLTQEEFDDFRVSPEYQSIRNGIPNPAAPKPAPTAPLTKPRDMFVRY